MPIGIKVANQISKPKWNFGKNVNSQKYMLMHISFGLCNHHSFGSAVSNGFEFTRKLQYFS